MRVHAVSAVVAFALMACGTPNMDMDVQQVFDSGTPMDVQRTDTGSTPTDTGPNVCDFEPGAVNPNCRILSQICTAGPITCDGGMTIQSIRCMCQDVRMFGQVWRCDNFCGFGADSGEATDAATE
jgi:hypothetical protein